MEGIREVSALSESNFSINSGRKFPKEYVIPSAEKNTESTTLLKVYINLETFLIVLAIGNN